MFSAVSRRHALFQEYTRTNVHDLEVFNQMPFLFWVKDEEGRYHWGNRSISELAKEDVTGKTDHELIWAENADALKAADHQVLETGKPSFLHEYVVKSGHGKATLNVCKFIGDLDGEKRVFGVSFIIDE